YLVHYSSSTGIMGIHILDAETGEDLGKLSTAGIQGGTQPIRKIAVSEDGIIYAGNVTTNTASNPYKLYRWTSETADPEVIWQGDPSNGEAGVLRNYGGNLDLRDNGDSTQIVIAPDYWEQNTEPHVVAVLNISGDETPIVTPQFIVTQPT